MRHAYINIGSNKGDRHHNIKVAVAFIIKLICETFGQSEEEIHTVMSEIYESEPWGYDSPNMFLNIGIRISIPSEIPPYQLLKLLQKAEASISTASHRNDDGGYADRYIDIDLIAMDGIQMDTDRLTLPHPRAYMRDFVMIPLIATLPEVSPSATGSATHSGTTAK